MLKVESKILKYPQPKAARPTIKSIHQTVLRSEAAFIMNPEPKAWSPDNCSWNTVFVGQQILPKTLGILITCTILSNITQSGRIRIKFITGSLTIICGTFH